MDELAEFHVHTAVVETFEGTGAYGDVYAAPATVSCLAEAKRRLVRSKDGEEVVSETSLYMTVADGGRFVPDSRVTVGGHTSFVITNSTNDAPGLDLPDHATVTLK